MRSVSGYSDGSATSRIRDTAVKFFGEKGFRGTSIRDIAQASRVTPGLVMYHFGSKDKLREACDNHVVTRLIGDSFNVLDHPSPNLVKAMLESSGSAAPELKYMARMLVEPSLVGNAVFKALVEDAERHLQASREAGSVTPASDTEATALLVTIFGLAQLLLREHLTQFLGSDPFSTEGARRLTMPTLELLTYGLYPDDSLLQTARAALSPQNETSRDAMKETK